MEGKFTPGPWAYLKVKKVVRGQFRGRRYHIYGGIPEIKPQGTDYETIAVVEKNSDARLIAAAPELLTALGLAVQALNAAPRFRVGDTDSYKIASVVDAAIAKAKGEA